MYLADKYSVMTSCCFSSGFYSCRSGERTII